MERVDIKSNDKNELTDKDKVVSLFKFIGELNRIKHKAITNYREYRWKLDISSIHQDDDNIRLCFRDRLEENDSTVKENDNLLLSIQKPEFQPCPKPDELFVMWLNLGWEDYREKISVKEYINLKDKDFATNNKSYDLERDCNENVEDDKSYIEYFIDDEDRVNAYEKWKNIRDVWVEKQKIIDKTRKLFTDLYSLYFELQRV